MIQDPADLRQKIRDADVIASRLEFRGMTLNLSERRVVAILLRDLADVARRAFDPNARRDWSLIPREPREEDDVPGLWPTDAA